MYRVGKRPKRFSRKAVIRLMVLLFIIGISFGGYIEVRNYFKPQKTITQSKAVLTTVNFATQTTTYTEPDFTIQLPKTWSMIPAPAGPYTTYNWEVSDHDTNGEELTIYEDTIPTNFAVNRVLDVDGSQLTQLTLDGQASDNCTQYTINSSAQVNNQFGAPARWQGINFLCDQNNDERDVIGTTSTDGINTVILKNTYGGSHKFFFTYTNHDLNPDYTVFYSALQSFRMK
jgi:hypothetical protein